MFRIFRKIKKEDRNKEKKYLDLGRRKRPGCFHAEPEKSFRRNWKPTVIRSSAIESVENYGSRNMDVKQRSQVIGRRNGNRSIKNKIISIVAYFKLASSLSRISDFAMRRSYDRFAKIKKWESLGYISIFANNTEKVVHILRKLKHKKFTLSSALASILIIAIISQIFFASSTQGATFHFQQTAWSSQTSNVADHNDDQSGWNEYSVKDASVEIVNGGEDVRLQNVQGSVTDTTDADFNQGVNNGTAVVGSGTDSSVKLDGTTIAVNDWERVLNQVPATIGPGGSMIRNGMDDDIYATRGNYSIGFYKYSISINSWTILASIPGSVNDGSKMIRNGSDNDIYLTRGGNYSNFYKYSISGNSWTTLTAAPGAIYTGSSVIRNGSDDSIYVTQGNNSTGFYKYSISANSWTTLTSIPGSINDGSKMIRNGSDDSIYVMQGNNGTNFYKYSISGNSWTTLTAAPGAIYTGSSVIRNGSDDDIYVTQGNNSTGFYKYSISGNSWTTLTAAPGYLGTGSNMIRNGSDDYVYVTRGAGITSFYRYSISGNSWTMLAAAPGYLGIGSNMIRSNSDGYIYVMRGQYEKDFYKYSISTDSWIVSKLTSTPGGIYDYSSMIRNGSDDEIYVTRGEGYADFYKYSISANSWTTLASIPGMVGYGSSMIRNGSEDFIYVSRGNSTDFYKYSIAANSWTTLAAIPGSVSLSSNMIRNGFDNDIYLTRGSGYDNFYKYSISTNSWISLTSSPGVISNGSNMIRNGSDDDLYITRGGNSTSFYKYSISGNSWSVLATTPAGIDADSIMIRNGSEDYIYLKRGNGYSDFYRYSISGNSWITLASTPSGTRQGTSMTRSGSEDYIYLVQGSGNGFYRYSITNNTWTSLNNVIGTVYYGGHMIRNGADNEFYVLGGNNEKGFYRYILNQITYFSSGTFVSRVVDTGQNNTNWSNLSWSELLMGQSVSIKARSCDDAACSSSGNTDESVMKVWAGCGNLLNGGNLASASPNCVSDGDRYIQYQISLSTSDTTKTPLFNDITFGYNYYEEGTLTSSIYDTTDSSNVLAKMGWTENLPANTDATFQIRTSSDNLTWTDWIGPDGTSASSFTDPAGNESMPAGVSDGIGDRYIQYKMALSTDGMNTPTVSSTDMTYVVNANPQLQNMDSIQGSDGVVSVSYEVRDPDTSTGVNQGTVAVTLQYCSANCATPGSETWTDATSVSGGVGASVAIEEQNFTAYQIAWNAKNDINGTFDNAFKIRLVASDGELANSTAYAADTLYLDTKNPENVAFSIDHIESELNLDSPTDNSSLQMSVSNYSDFRDNPAYEAVQAVYSYGALTSDPATVYLRIKDAYGNYVQVQQTTPAKPTNVLYYDVSNTSSGQFREFVAWDVISALQVGSGFSAYKLYRSTDGESYSELASIADRTQNYYMDDGLTEGTHYYYKLYAEDTNGNKSEYSQVVQDTPDGQGGSDLTPPTNTNLNVSEITTTSARVTWNTDELADSSVGYSEDETYLPERGIASMTLNHEIVLTNLNPDTTYNIRVKSRDVVGNLGQNDNDNPGSSPIQNFAFTTLPGPAISAVTVPHIANNEATITWKTTTDSNSYVVYSDTVSNGSLLDSEEVGAPDMVGGSALYDHTVTINNFGGSPLVSNLRYYFFVKSVDSSGNIATDDNGGNFYELLTTSDSTPPEISNLGEPIVSDQSAAISWVTDESADSLVEYGKTSGLYDLSQSISSYDRSHFVILPSLETDTDYYYQVTSSDINGNETISSEGHFKTTKEPALDHEPLSTITFANSNPSVLTDTTAVVSFATDQEAECFAEYGTVAGQYQGVPVSESGRNMSHAIHLMGLVFNTKYFYKITCEDNLGTVVSSDEKDFTTKEKLMTGGEWGESNGGDYVAPSISNVKSSEVTGESVTITWDTDENSNSLVKYGTDGNYTNVAGDSNTLNDESQFAKSHSVSVDNIIPSTKYLFRVVSADADGNSGESDEYSFTTSVSSSISSIKAESKEIGQATITWNTSNDTSSIVEYGTSTDYSESKESSSLTKEHEIVLSGLNQGVTYHFRVKGKDGDGKIYASSDQTFEPKSPPKISDISIKDADEHAVTISFRTNAPTDANVTYINVRDKAETGSQGKPDFMTDHSIRLDGLNPGTTYSIKIAVRDEQGTQSEQQGPDFTTGKDENPPVIDQVKTETALTQYDKVQTIISWKTDEQAISRLIYKEGQKGEEKEIVISDNPTNMHIAILTTFKPGLVYYFKAKSIDASGNEAVSNDYALLTPRRKENIIQIIINNFQDIFSWTRR